MIIKIKNEIINLPDNKVWEIYMDFNEKPWRDILNCKHNPYFYITVIIEDNKENYDFDSLEELESNYKELLEQIKSKLF
jgi:hypothetical protein